MTSSAVEPATFRFVEQCINQMRHRVCPTFGVPQQKLWVGGEKNGIQIFHSLQQRISSWETSCTLLIYFRNPPIFFYFHFLSFIYSYPFFSSAPTSLRSILLAVFTSIHNWIMTTRHTATANMCAETHAKSTSTEQVDTLFPSSTSCWDEAKEHCCG